MAAIAPADGHAVRTVRLALVYDRLSEGRPVRALQPDAVKALAASMALIGLQTPITVRSARRIHNMVEADVWEVVAGRHRVAAARSLAWREIQANVLEGGSTEARLWEISENLHRAELTALERSELMAEWVRLTKPEQEPAQEEPKPRSRSRSGAGAKPGQNVQVSGGRGKKGGVAEAARQLPVPGKTEEAKRKNVQRALDIAGLSPEAKAAARELGLDTKQTALLIASKEEGAEAQVNKLRAIAEEKRKAPAFAPEPEPEETDDSCLTILGAQEAVDIETPPQTERADLYASLARFIRKQSPTTNKDHAEVVAVAFVANLDCFLRECPTEDDLSPIDDATIAETEEEHAADVAAEYLSTLWRTAPDASRDAFVIDHIKEIRAIIAAETKRLREAVLAHPGLRRRDRFVFQDFPDLPTDGQDVMLRSMAQQLGVG